MKIFSLNKTYVVVCDTKGTRNGFKHVATLCRNGYNVAETKICYLNCTWERFTYQSILKKIIEYAFKDKEKQKYLNAIKNLG